MHAFESAQKLSALNLNNPCIVCSSTVVLCLQQNAVLTALQQGLAPLTTVVRGDFTKMPFEANSFNGAYAIEATCHAPKVGATADAACSVQKCW
jgi:hypothetical protein